MNMVQTIFPEKADLEKERTWKTLQVLYMKKASTNYFCVNNFQLNTNY